MLKSELTRVLLVNIIKVFYPEHLDVICSLVIHDKKKKAYIVLLPHCNISIFYGS